MILHASEQWIDSMKQYHIEAAHEYAKFQHFVFTEGALSKKDKHLILVGMNAARRYEQEMLVHTKDAMKEGASVGEIVDILTSCILSRGIPAWLEGVKAIQSIHEESMEKEKTQNNVNMITVDDAVNYFKNDNQGVIPEWVNVMKKYSPTTLIHYATLRKNELCDLSVSRKLKEFVLLGINLVERYEPGVNIHFKGAKAEGATINEMIEVGLLSVLASGIPAWSLMSELLTKEYEMKEK